MDADQRYSDVVKQMHGAAAEFKEVLAQYDIEFEEKGQQMSEKLHKVTQSSGWFAMLYSASS